MTITTGRRTNGKKPLPPPPFLVVTASCELIIIIFNKFTKKGIPNVYVNWIDTFETLPYVMSTCTYKQEPINSGVYKPTTQVSSTESRVLAPATRWTVTRVSSRAVPASAAPVAASHLLNLKLNQSRALTTSLLFQVLTTFTFTSLSLCRNYEEK